MGLRSYSVLARQVAAADASGVAISQDRRLFARLVFDHIGEEK
jgi:hypothetical protein